MVLGCFFFSGATSLMYEILWIRLIVQIIGSAPFAVSIILTIFMAGLGLGSFMAGKILNRIKTPSLLVMIYGVLELAIGIYSLALPHLISTTQPLYVLVYNHLFDQFLVYTLITFLGCTLILIFPVVCMGATLPVLCKFHITSLSRIGAGAGLLYSLNTIGAAFGAIVCGFWLLGYFGVSGTLNIAVAINLFIGTACVLMGLVLKRKPATTDLAVSDKKDNKVAYDGAGLCALIIFGVSGFCSMAYEVIWTRLLGLIVGPTIYSFTLILITFILGIAIGSYLFGRLADRIGKPFHLLVMTQIGAAFSVIGVSQMLGTSQLFFAKLIFLFKDQFMFMNLVKAGALLLFMIVPTILLGASFPLVGKILARSVDRIGQVIGYAYAVNTLGAVAGSFLAGFVLIPFLGKETGLGLVVGLQLFTVLTVSALVFFKSSAGKKKYFAVTALAIAGIVLCFFYPEWDHFMLSKGKYYRFNKIGTNFEKLSWYDALFKGKKIFSKQKNKELVFYGDGVAGFTTVFKSQDPFGNENFSLYNSGKADASSRGDMATQTLSAHFPMLFHKNPENVMVLGLASGVTAGEVLHYPVKELDVVDINDQVIKASEFFSPWNNKLLSDPRTRLIIQDGRAHLSLTDKTYDVIISEPSNPWMAGLSALFTQNFFSIARNRLKNDGIFVQFIHSYEMDWKNFSLVGRTFADVFPQSLLIVTSPSGHGSDFLLVGFKGKRDLSVDTAGKNHKYALKSNNISLPDPRLFFRLIVSENLPFLFEQGPLNTDDMPYLEFSAPALIYKDTSSIPTAIRFRRRLSPKTIRVVQVMTKNIESQIDFAQYALSVHKPFRNMVDLSRATSSSKNRLYKLLKNYYSDNKLDKTILPDELLIQCRQTQILKLEKRMGTLLDRTGALYYLAGLYHAKGEYDKEKEKLSDLLKIQPGNAEIYNNIGSILGIMEKYEQAIPYFEKSISLQPDNKKARQNLQAALTRIKNIKNNMENSALKK